MGSFVRLPAGLTSILLAIERLEPLEQATKVHALVGNPAGSALPAPSLVIRYGSIASSGVAAGELRFRLDRPLPAGSWTHAVFVLPSIAPEELIRVEAAVELENQAAEACLPSLPYVAFALGGSLDPSNRSA
jgi:hypothetical protein